MTFLGISGYGAWSLLGHRQERSVQPMLEMVQNGASRCGTNLAKAVFNCRQVHQEWQAWLANAF